jgi:thiamine-phosphate pyrophosphorylase
VLTDYHFQQRHTHAELARLAAIGGADTVQFRQKRGALRHILHQAAETAAVCATFGVPLIIDDYVAVAAAVNAAGVHLGAEDLPVAAARRVLGEAFLIGASATTPEAAAAAVEDGADYIGFGPVFATRSKDNPASVKGVDALAYVCQAVSVPVIAIAGITIDRVEAVMAAGAHGVAVMTAVTNSEDPTRAASVLREEIEKYRR